MVELSMEERKEMLDEEKILAFSCAYPELGDFIVYYSKSSHIVDDVYVVVAEPGTIAAGELPSLSPEKDTCSYQGVMTLSGEVLVPLSEMELKECFSDSSNENYCFTFQKQSGEFQSFLIYKEEGQWFPIHIKSSSTASSFRFFQEISVPGCWMWKGTHPSGIEEFQVYSYEEKRFISNYFHEISFDVEDTGYYAYVRRDLFDYSVNQNGQEEAVYFGSLFGYVDENFHFACPIFDTKTKQMVPTVHFAKLTDFDTYVNEIMDAYYYEYLSEQAQQEEALLYMQSHPNPKKVAQAKILSFRRKGKEKGE